MGKNELSKRFRIFAEKECKGSSKLYWHLSNSIANDPELLQLAGQSRAGQPIPNLLFGAVHYLLLGGIEHELSRYYASIVNEPLDPSTAIHCFKVFCKQYESRIIHVLKSKLVQTNEVKRCAYLYPSFCHIHSITNKPLALIEIGTSAGLQLLWDRYSYVYHSNGETYGNVLSNLKIASEIRGDKYPSLLKHSPPVTDRIGLDLHVNNLNNSDDYLWLKALIWPEHTERISYFETAALCLEKQPLKLIEGDGVALLPNIVSKITKDATVCIFHTHVANQIPEESKMTLMKHIKNIGREREVFHLYNNMWDLDLHLDYYSNGNVHEKTIARTDGHGQWFEWYLD